MALRKHHSADRILLPLSQENLERRKEEKKRRRHHSTAAAATGVERRWGKILVIESAMLLSSLLKCFYMGCLDMDN